MDKLTDAHLITLYLDGNQKALEGLINRHAQSVYRFTLKLTGDKDLANDITQETLIKFWKNIKKFDKSKNLKTWLFTIAKNSSIDVLRKRKDVNFSKMNFDTINDNDEDFEQSIHDTEPLQSEIFETNENSDLVQKALDMLTIENRLIVLLKNGEEMTFDEISSVIGRPLNTVKSQYRRALINLKNIIGVRRQVR